MKSAERTGSYHSPLREAQAAATRERILDTLGALLEGGEEPTYAAIAQGAAIQERTIFRHFPTKDELYRAFWQRVHEQRIVPGVDPTDRASLLRFVGEVFAGFDQNEQLVLAMLHSTHGRSIRLTANEERRRRFERIVSAELPEAKAAERRRAAAALQVLCSGMTWEYLRNVWEMSSDESIATVRQAITALLAGLQPPQGPRQRRKDPP
jgi:AcrR family transcriptional regulator